MSYEEKKAAFLRRLKGNQDSPLTTEHQPKNESKPQEYHKKPMTYAQVSADVSFVNRSTYNQICHHMLWIPDFKRVVFELLESYHFEECSTFDELLQKWRINDDTGMPTLAEFFSTTEPVVNKLPFYQAAFEYLTTVNLAEFLAESITNGDLSSDFVITLGNSIP